ncbi:sensor histidine kinase [Alteromonas oceanisediminis]|uniref:sensor histidine kinase n=1 Tax=Alteromonas oceanisediminis TaxID=2836180 RepID=UPI001BDA8D98|nr:histidine kinase [Alteromonas oceanisediminis]MBT0585897.1 histidine kinase [Alteromonas oceanisediminis]
MLGWFSRANGRHLGGILIASYQDIAHSDKMFSRFFWLANTLLWCSVLVFFSYAQSRNAQAAELEITWFQFIEMLAPWFLNFIWVTPAIFAIVHRSMLLDAEKRWHERFVKPALASLGILFCYWTLSLVMQTFIRDQSFNDFLHRLYRVILSTGVIDIVIYFGILAAAIGAHFYHESMKERVMLTEIKQELITEQLKSLRSQLNPHFLFNTLNTVTSLIRIGKINEATDAIAQLSTMLRATLENKNQETVTLQEEMAFINSYIGIQKLRFADKLKVDISVAEGCLAMLIPNMLLQPLVENAVQHGSQSVEKDNLIELVIAERAGKLSITLTNQIAETDLHNGFGIGLNNTRKRLEQIYEDYQFESVPLTNGLFRTLLLLPLTGKGKKHA